VPRRVAGERGVPLGFLNKNGSKLSKNNRMSKGDVFLLCACPLLKFHYIHMHFKYRKLSEFNLSHYQFLFSVTASH